MKIDMFNDVQELISRSRIKTEVLTKEIVKYQEDNERNKNKSKGTGNTSKAIKKDEHQTKESFQELGINNENRHVQRCSRKITVKFFYTVHAHSIFKTFHVRYHHF